MIQGDFPRPRLGRMHPVIQPRLRFRVHRWLHVDVNPGTIKVYVDRRSAGPRRPSNLSTQIPWNFCPKTPKRPPVYPKIGQNYPLFPQKSGQMEPIGSIWGGNPGYFPNIPHISRILQAFCGQMARKLRLSIYLSHCLKGGRIFKYIAKYVGI